MSSEASPLRVLAVTNMYPTQGDPAYGAFVQSQMNSIAALGHTVVVNFIDGRRSSWAYVQAIERIRRIVKRQQFDVLHAHYGLAGFVSVWQKVPVVVSFCGDDLLGTPAARGGLTMKSRLERRLSRFVAPRASGIICKSTGLRDALPRSFDRLRAQVIPNGVDTLRFHPGDRREARSRLGVNDQERLVLFPSTPAERRKRLDLATSAVHDLQTDGIDARLWVVQGVAPTEMPLYYQAADCLLLTSDWEGSANVVKEALCCDLPVVTVDAGDASFWIGMVPGCHLVQRTPWRIAQALREVLTVPLRVDGHEVRNALAIGSVAKRVVAVYRSAIREAATSGAASESGRRR